MPKRAVFLVNLGSPDSTSIPDVRRYLREFLGDPRVLDMNPVLRWLILEGSILRKRPKETAHAYSTVWTKEGSPLIVTSVSVQRKLAAALGADMPVYLAMRYGRPAIGDVVARMAADGVEEALLFPQYPHFAMSSWETVTAKVEAERARRAPRMRITCVDLFYADADYIEALHAVSAPYLAQPHDHLLFSYHGLPARHMRKADPTGSHCLCSADCCTTPSPAHATCYRAQVFATTRAFVARAGIPAAGHSVAFQSRLVGEPWLEPFTDVELEKLAKSGVRRLLVMCPAFVTDCLETIE
jgi:ferrochelatase